jgi:hypothetical protein
MQEKFGKSLAALKAAQIGTSDSRRSDLQAWMGVRRRWSCVAIAERSIVHKTVERLRHRSRLRG